MILVGDWCVKAQPVKVKLELAPDLYLGNLEGPVLAENNDLLPALKAGSSLFSSKLPNFAGQFVFSIANNHIMDYGQAGLESTIELLDQRGFKACGAGNNICDARESRIVEDKGVHVGIIACCEAQFGVARRNSPGVAEFGPWIYRTIRALCKTGYTVIVTFHAAIEDSPWPSPHIRELYRSFIDTGATVVHGHHAHVPQGYEAYGNGVIFYGMGNFAVDPDQWRSYPNGMWSLAAEIDLSSVPVHWRPLTLEIRHESCTDTIVIQESNAEEQLIHRCYMEICNRPFNEPELFDALWQEIALRSYFHYGKDYMRFSAAQPQGWFRRVREALRLVNDAILNRASASKTPSQRDYLLWHVMIGCESHRQMLATALGILAGEIKDLRNQETMLLVDEMMPWSRGVISA